VQCCQKYTPTSDCFFGDFAHWVSANVLSIRLETVFAVVAFVAPLTN